MTRKVLGRGLGALIPSRTPDHHPPPAAPLQQAGLLQLDLGKIVPNPHQPRKEFAADKLEELSASIAARGLIQPVIVRPLADGRYELIAGERRWRAAAKAGLARIPAVVRQAESAEAIELALIENIQRQDLNPIETAEAYRHLAETFDLSHEEIAVKVGKDRSSVTNLLRLLNLPEEIQKDLAAGTLSMGHARALLGVPDRAGQLAARAAVLAKGLSVRETELLVKRLARPKKETAGKNAKKDIYINELESSMRNALGTKVTIRHRGKSGVIELHYFSVEELDRLVNHLR
ncbi:MAG: ParB/RepB/Spo0J family partition protein [Candidatus Methylomirabilia bacterium]